MTERIIITTSGKTGSYLLMSMMDSHPEILVFPIEYNLIGDWLSFQYGVPFNEVDYYSMPIKPVLYREFYDNQINRLFRLLDLRDKDALERCKACGIDYGNIGYEAFIDHLQTYQEEYIDINQWIDLVENAYAKSISARKYKYFVIKDVVPESFIRYCNLIKNCRFIHLTRNPYDVYNAFKRSILINKKQSYFFSSGDLLEFVTEKLQSQYGNLRYVKEDDNNNLIVKYEDIVGDTETITKKISEWLGISVDRTMLSPTLGGRPFVAYSDNRKVKHNAKINRARIGVYNETVGKTEIKFFDLILGEDMRSIGYKVTYDVSTKNFITFFLKTMLPLKLELKNMTRHGFFGILKLIVAIVARRFFMWNKVYSAKNLRALDEMYKLNFQRITRAK
jgi:hypothetical protein